jgi:hypothetical protein
MFSRTKRRLPTGSSTTNTASRFPGRSNVLGSTSRVSSTREPSTSVPSREPSTSVPSSSTSRVSSRVPSRVSSNRVSSSKVPSSSTSRVSSRVPSRVTSSSTSRVPSSRVPSNVFNLGNVTGSEFNLIRLDSNKIERKRADNYSNTKSEFERYLKDDGTREFSIATLLTYKDLNAVINIIINNFGYRATDTISTIERKVILENLSNVTERQIPIPQNLSLKIIQTSGNENDCLIHSLLTVVNDYFRFLNIEHKKIIASFFRRVFLPQLYDPNNTIDGFSQINISDLQGNYPLEDSILTKISYKYDLQFFVINDESINRQSIDSKTQQRIINTLKPTITSYIKVQDIKHGIGAISIEKPSYIIHNSGNAHYSAVCNTNQLDKTLLTGISQYNFEFVGENTKFLSTISEGNAESAGIENNRLKELDKIMLIYGWELIDDSFTTSNVNSLPLNNKEIRNARLNNGMRYYRIREDRKEYMSKQNADDYVEQKQTQNVIRTSRSNRNRNTNPSRSSQSNSKSLHVSNPGLNLKLPIPSVSINPFTISTTIPQTHKTQQQTKGTNLFNNEFNTNYNHNNNNNSSFVSITPPSSSNENNSNSSSSSNNNIPKPKIFTDPIKVQIVLFYDQNYIESKLGVINLISQTLKDREFYIPNSNTITENNNDNDIKNKLKITENELNAYDSIEIQTKFVPETGIFQFYEDLSIEQISKILYYRFGLYVLLPKNDTILNSLENVTFTNPPEFSVIYDTSSNSYIIGLQISKNLVSRNKFTQLLRESESEEGELVPIMFEISLLFNDSISCREKIELLKTALKVNLEKSSYPNAYKRLEFTEENCNINSGSLSLNNGKIYNYDYRIHCKSLIYIKNPTNHQEVNILLAHLNQELFTIFPDARLKENSPRGKFIAYISNNKLNIETIDKKKNILEDIKIEVFFPSDEQEAIPIRQPIPAMNKFSSTIPINNNNSNNSSSFVGGYKTKHKKNNTNTTKMKNKSRKSKRKSK